jgi:argininosuccinate lyase
MTLWSGRFDDAPADVLWRYTASQTDRRLLAVDIRGSIAHVGMLADVGLIDATEHQAIDVALHQLLADAEDGTFEFLDTDEDVHSAVERRLIELIGDTGRKLHTGRSRNDQIALDIRLYLLETSAIRQRQLAEFAGTLIELAQDNAEVIVPSYTHLQQAQAIPLAHHLLAYAWMAIRSRSRFVDLDQRLSVSPLGASASGGSSLPIDPYLAAQRLGFPVVFPNSLDAVGARDLVAEYVFCCTQTMVDLSRLSEELVLWATSEFGWVTFSDSLTTGSSALPQKKNPDIAELARGKTAGAIGSLTAIMALQKALPLAYNRDLQEDKEHVFAVDDALGGTLEAITAMLASARFHPPQPGSWVMALDFAEVLVERGVPFRQAHELVGRLVSTLLASNRTLADVTAGDLLELDERFEAQDVALADPAESIRRRTSSGGGSFESVSKQIEALQRLLS